MMTMTTMTNFGFDVDEDDDDYDAADVVRREDETDDGVLSPWRGGARSVP